MKTSRDEHYVLGLFSNTDWDLLRQADRPVWLTSGKHDPSHGVVAAIECRLDGSAGSLELDHRVFERARRVAAAYGAPFHLVHAYELPNTAFYAGYVPLFADAPVGGAAASRLEAERTTERHRVARLHGAAIQRFVDEHDIVLQDVKVVEGNPPTVIKAEAELHQAGLVVMGAADKGRWDRVLGRVTAEPTLEGAPCDLLFVH